MSDLELELQKIPVERNALSSEFQRAQHDLREAFGRIGPVHNPDPLVPSEAF